MSCSQERERLVASVSHTRGGLFTCSDLDESFTNVRKRHLSGKQLIHAFNRMEYWEELQEFQDTTDEERDYLLTNSSMATHGGL